MASLEQILERKKEVTGQISTQTRTLAYGLLAISWALLTAHDDPLKAMATHVSRTSVLALAVLSVLVIAFDLLQYVFAEKVAQAALNEAENSTCKAVAYKNNSYSYKLQVLFYKMKFFLLVLASILLIYIFISLFRAS